MKVFYQTEFPKDGDGGKWEEVTKIPIEYLGRVWDYEPFVHVAYMENEKGEIFVEWNIEGIATIRVQP